MFSKISTLFLTAVFSSVITVMVILVVGSLLLQEYRSEVSAWLFAATSPAEVAEKLILPKTDSEQTISVIAAANPAVVSVVVTKDVPIFERYFEEFMPFGLFGGSVLVPRVRQSGTEAVEVGGGSGFVISSDGLIVTNRHVVDDTTASYSILTNEGVPYQVEVVAKDPVLDVAILAINSPLPTPLPFLEFGDSESLALGEPVIAIGNALAEFRNSVSVGVVSGLSRTIVAGDRSGMSQELEGVIQTDAAINPGNSGGPLINLAGEVIGVNVAASTEAENIGFALPAHVVEEVIEVLVARPR